MKFHPPLREGVLLRRYKRFLADVRFPDGTVTTAVCPNTGSMRSCCEPGRPVMLSHHPETTRRYAYTWEMIRMERGWVGVNTSIPNNLTALAVKYGAIPELISYTSVRREIPTSRHTRLDLLLEGPIGTCYVEIKNVSLCEGEVAYFPDAVTERGAKHLDELVRLSRQGHKTVMMFVVQREDCSLFKPADAIDPDYGKKLREAAAAGVEILVYQALVSPTSVRWGRCLPKDLTDVFRTS
ncbi:MAG TPA: DNA/RNA nuclease SfsA [Elusimicrobiota bacterium]|nr:DNA/RNA nuclease SfsA [Elusimicrobiota bacterium]